jgi:circadian clock protein KaiB
MPRKKAIVRDSVQDFEKVLQEPGDKKYLLRLFVSGASLRSSKAIENIRKLSEEHLKGRYELEVVDIYQQPELMKKEQILAAPTLVRKLPLPLRKMIGDMSDKEKVLIGLDIIPTESTGSNRKDEQKEKKQNRPGPRKRK